ncbi:MAG: hypothetical protein ACYC9O_10715 [Candidatus Latescibacterota bacterium]
MHATALKAAVVFLVFVFIRFGSAGAIESELLTTGTARARALAMGGAYSSLEDDLSSGLYNPAAFRVNAARTERRYRLFFNPVGSVSAFHDYSRYDLDYRVDRKITETEILQAASMLVKGAVFTTPAIDIGLVFHEPVIGSDSSGVLRERFFSAEKVTRESLHSAFVNVKIAQTISLGLSGTVFRTRENGKMEYRSGHTFGVLIDPTPKMKVGLAYVQMPEEAADTRAELESIGSGTITGGISYYPDQETALSVDVRNMNREDRPSSREIHAGAERIFRKRVALRFGYFRKKDTNDDVYSFGLGILPLWDRITKYRYSTRNDLFSYTFIMEEGNSARRWHVLSLLLRY